MFYHLHNGIGRVLNDFKESLRQWKAWDHITIVENHQQIRSNLHDLYQRVPEVGWHICLAPLFL